MKTKLKYCKSANTWGYIFNILRLLYKKGLNTNLHFSFTHQHMWQLLNWCWIAQTLWKFSFDPLCNITIILYLFQSNSTSAPSNTCSFQGKCQGVTTLRAQLIIERVLPQNHESFCLLQSSSVKSQKDDRRGNLLVFAFPPGLNIRYCCVSKTEFPVLAGTSLERCVRTKSTDSSPHTRMNIWTEQQKRKKSQQFTCTPHFK